jgi:hypothetical protein
MQIAYDGPAVVSKRVFYRRFFPRDHEIGGIEIEIVEQTRVHADLGTFSGAALSSNAVAPHWQLHRAVTGLLILDRHAMAA